MTTIQICEVCECQYKLQDILPGSPTKLCRLCIDLGSCELRFHPYILLNKVIASGNIFSLSEIELSELNISAVFRENPVLRQHVLLNDLAFLLEAIFC